MAQTIEDVNSRTILQQFHSLYERQNETETDVQNIDAKIDQETNDRQTADLSINIEIQALRDEIDSLGVLFTYKGEVATIQDLPVTDNKPGDVYYVDSEQSGYVWLEKSGVYQWEEFGPAIDLSEYAKQEDLQQIKSEVDAMNTQVESNTSNIVSLTNTKQDKLTAGTNITIDANNVISASGGTNNAVTLDNTQQEFESSKTLILKNEGFDNLKFQAKDNVPYVAIDRGFSIKIYFNVDHFMKLNYNYATGNMSVFNHYNSSNYNIDFPSKSGTFALTSDIDAKVPNAPDTDDTYTLKCVVSNGVKTYQWVSDTQMHNGGSEEN